jgi:hypothetical protein
MRSDSSVAASERRVRLVTACRGLDATSERLRGVFQAHTSMSSLRV